MDPSPSPLKSGSQESLDLSRLPPIFISTTHLDLHDLHDLEDQILEVGGNLTYDVKEAKLVLSRAERKRRIEFDFRSWGLWVEQVLPDTTTENEPPEQEKDLITRPPKRRKLENIEVSEQSGAPIVVIDGDESTASEGEDARTRPEALETDSPILIEDTSKELYSHTSVEDSLIAMLAAKTVKVVKVEWFEDCLKAGKILPITSYLTYEGRHISKPSDSSTVAVSKATTSTSTSTPKSTSPKAILERAKADAPAKDHFSHGYRGNTHRRFGSGGSSGGAGTTFSHGGKISEDKSRYAHLLQESTSEYEGNISSDIPEMPEWVKANLKYSCERVTLADSPNAAFIDQLQKIKLARLLTNDEVGVRAYSTSIAALASYPHKISTPREILHLPGCDVKIANLYIDYINNGSCKPADDAENNDDLKVLRLFYNIWGVGAFTAREFYYERGWKELDDIIEFGWSTLSRVQQIGVKYYEEFLSPIPRAEVESIADIITRHAKKVRDDDIQALVVGGYRRGKEECGDVDIIVSHPSEAMTKNIVSDIVASLEEEGWITHTLLLALTNSNRGQQTLPFKGEDSRGSGFDTLDKALVVWQDPVWPTRDADLEANPKAKNPNIHRRVDIIISPWRTVGCAVAGWSGGTTFQRDLRRYAKNVKGWKFDSSGVRERGSGMVVDVEGWAHEATRAKTMVEAERRVFEGFGLVFREPWERCTG